MPAHLPKRSSTVLTEAQAKGEVAHFLWIISQLRIAAEQAAIPNPGVIILDFDTALKNALDSVFPATQEQLCTWQKNVVLHIKKNWEDLLMALKLRMTSQRKILAAAP